MPIKFSCPHCKRVMTVKDQMAGKKGNCTGCKQVVTVPRPTAAPPAPNATGATQTKPVSPKTAAPQPNAPPAAVDVEAEAAALFSDEPPPSEPTETQTIDLNCPFCDEPIHFSADLAGKKAPCPECKRIIKVPELVKQERKDWRKADPRAPSGARPTDQPAPEGAWGSVAASTVGKQALVEAGVIPTKQPPRTLWQKSRWPVLGAAVALLLAGGGWLGYRWWEQRAADRALQAALDYAASPQSGNEVRATGQAAIFLGAGEYRLHAQTPGCAVEANKQFGKAFVTVKPAAPDSERDGLLTDQALAQSELGGGEPDTGRELRLPWEETQKMLLASLREIQNPEARREAVRAISQRLSSAGQSMRALALLRQIYPTTDDERAAALSVVALELSKSNDRATGEKAAEEALKLYESKTPPPVRAEVVAVAGVFGKPAPKPGKEPKPGELAAEYVGLVENLARQDHWDRARQKAGSNDYGDIAQFQALLALASAAVDAKVAGADDVEKAIHFAESKLRDKPELAWSFLRLTQLAIRAGLPDERLQAFTAVIADRAVRGRAQLAIFLARLDQAKQIVEDSAADKVEPRSLSRLRASQALARHNTQLERGWAKAVQGWQQPMQAFGSLGIALGLQDRDKGK
jgi:hypothetical protein